VFVDGTVTGVGERSVTGVLASGITLSRGVGKKTGVCTSSHVDSVSLGGSSEVSRYPGSFDKSPGDWHSYPSRTQEAEKAQLIERSRRLEPGVLPLMAGTRRCCVSF
jgi:hypothetical protein